MLFDSSLRRELSKTFGATLVVILTIMLTAFLIRTLRDASSGRVGPQDVVLFLGFITLGQLATMLAISLFIAVVLSLSRLYRDSEMVIWNASGAGLSRFVRPVLRMAWPVLALVGVLVLVVWPWGHQQMTELRQRYEQRSDIARVAPGVFQSSSDGRRVFFVEREGLHGVGARNVFILQRDDGTEAVTSAQTGRLVSDGPDRFLELGQGQRNQIDQKTQAKTVARFERYRVLAEDRALTEAGEPAPRATASPALWRAARGGNTAAQAELVWRLGLWAAAVNLVLLGIGLAASNPRRPSNWNLLFALLAFIIYFNLINLSQAWVASGRAAALPAFAALHGGAALLALLLIYWRDHAIVARWRGWRLWPRREAKAA
jgi:lipopolysaccharide export system permease protein